jgi:hypothetical protein
MPLKSDLRGRSAEERRTERDELHFLRQPPVRWFEPALLLKAALEVAVSGTFGKFADKRELQRDPQGSPVGDPGSGHGFFDHSANEEVWLDFLSDTGDGWEATATMAWLLAQPALTLDGEELTRGEAVLLGGDQVYPTADPEAYEDRFVGPFAGALPWSEDEDAAPRMYATPGNHDWYDGLTSFLRLFCQEKWIGGWRTRQRRSYYALKLPHRWWVWAIDIQLDTYIDDTQLEYFKQVGLQKGDKVILLTAKPSWVKAYDRRVEPGSWRYLAYFEEHAIRRRQGRLALTLTGDLHHYSRYEPHGEGAAEAPKRITAGGGGAYLSCTHTLREKVNLKALGPGEPVEYRREQIYPRAEDSKRLSRGILGLAGKNPGFANLLGGIYALAALAMLAALSGAPGGLVETGTGSLVDYLGHIASGAPLLLAILLTGALAGYTDITPSPLTVARLEILGLVALRIVVGALHALLHLVLAALAVRSGLELGLPPALVWVFGAAAAFVVGYVVGTTLFATVLLAVHRVFGRHAERAANEVFAGQGISGYKNFIRMRLNAEGLTLFPIGVDEVCGEWDRVEGEHPGFRPSAGHEPRTHLIDEQIPIAPPPIAD